MDRKELSNNSVMQLTKKIQVGWFFPAVTFIIHDTRMINFG